jgi:hypothetical protein
LSETGFQQLRRIYKAIEDAALGSPWDREPFAVMRKSKPGASTNEIRMRRAVTILRWADPHLRDIASQMEERSDNIFRPRCRECGMSYDPKPGDEGICGVCDLDA